MRSVTDSGTVISDWHVDFHMVGARVDANGNEQKNCYSKNGPRPVEKSPDYPSNFKPKTRERATNGDGKALKWFWERRNIRTFIYELPDNYTPTP